MAQGKQQLWPVAQLLLLGIVFHLVFIGTVFDCYFTSPVVHGMKAYGQLDDPSKAPAKRLVLIVGDGLRADFVFSPNASDIVPGVPELVAPHLRDIIEHRGAWGVSHTRVPTESRPGHVALIAGMYEDVSAVTKVWKTNPVDFDSVFNRSSHTFSFGSPDILPMFEHGATPGKVKTWMYNEEDEDFTKDATELDIWVYDQLAALFKNATTDAVLDGQLRDNRVVFFLHLLGLDTTGHSYRPHSKEYMHNIAVVDDIVKKTEKLFEDFYADDRTSFIFTADHGMSVIGNHGDGDPDNTRTPLIAWGAGVRKPILLDSPDVPDDYSAPFELEHLARRDVEQADVAAIMSTLLGSDWPVNSVGRLPDVDPLRPGFLDISENEIALAGLTNMQVLLVHYITKHNTKSQHAYRYKPFPKLEHSRVPGEYPGRPRVAELGQLARAHDWITLREKTVDLIDDLLLGLRYLETYDRTLIQSLVASSYTGWMALCWAVLLFSPPESSGSILNPVRSEGAPFPYLIGAAWAMFWNMHAKWTLYLYVIFPVMFWQVALSIARPHLRLNVGSLSAKVCTLAVLATCTLQGMVAAYTSRTLWSVGFNVIGLLWPRTWPSGVKSDIAWIHALWPLSCLATAIFPLLSVSPAEDVATIMFGGAVMVLLGLYGASQVANANARRLVILQVLLIALSMLSTFVSASSLQAKNGLPLVSQISGWTIFLIAILPPFLSPQTASVNTKILMYFLAFCPCFVILSIRAEGLFYISYCATLWLWVQTEAAVRDASVRQEQSHQGAQPNEGSASNWNPGKLRLDDVRIAHFFLFFVQVGFFGTGNVASISSFYLEPVYRLVPVFNPFLMASLLLFKILSPYVLLSACFATLNARLRMPGFALFLIALALTDGMTLTFFFKVTDTGSWLEIGQTISHFCITSLLLVFSAGIVSLGGILVGGSGADAPVQDSTK
ncbi:PigN-domain-containing protein [Peniophora sp. CONT]|nr:PigN-domain-containing protein [Peniophora sp. CONT]